VAPGGGLLIILYVAFVSLGLPDGVLGVAWPSVRRSFGLPLSQLGVLLATATAGYLASCVLSGPIVARLGVGRVLLGSTALMTLSCLAYALAPAWPVMVGSGALAGLGAGAVDAGINAFAAAYCSPRRTSVLHACYGVGAMLGPVLMSAMLAGGQSWRWGYGVLAVALGALSATFAVTLPRWPRAGDAPAGGTTRMAPAAGLGDALATPAVWMHVALFFLYTGLEVTAGQWTYSLFTEARGATPAVAGGWISAYWGSLTVGRLLAAALTRRWPAESLLRLGLLAAPPAALSLWLDGGGILGPLGLAALGLAFAPVYPLLVSLTPRRLGAGLAPHAMGLQVAAAYAGTAAVPGLAGLLAGQHGLEVVGPFLLAGTAGLLLLAEGVTRLEWPARLPAAGPGLPAGDGQRSG